MELMFLQWFFWSFTAGVFAGGLILGFGFLLGKLHSRSSTKQVPDEAFDPDAEVVSEEFFEEAWSGEGEFPTDAELEDLHRHSTY